MSELEILLQKVYMEGYRDSTRRASGEPASTHAATLKIKKLAFALIGKDEPVDKQTNDQWAIGRNQLRARLRKKVEEL